ncbi:hypothetical protein AYX07_02125 [Thermoactinomyces sp. AS95]|jgi:hypothetical protein|nr:hypothetical protein AYX07_02125 [Thermoactinomyces sp. AS95]
MLFFLQPVFSAVYGFSDQYAGLRWGNFFLCTFSAVTAFSVCFHWRERREHRFIKGKKNENVQ